jgi:exonuclease III
MPKTRDIWPREDGLTIGFLNINSARHKVDDIAYILNNSGKRFHIFGFAESRLTKSIHDNEMQVDGYDIIRLDPQAPKATGLLVYISKTLTFSRLNSLENFNVETIWIELKFKHSKSLFVGFLYRNPSETVDWYNRFEDMMDAVSLKNKELILLGDFNIDLKLSKPKWTIQYKTYNLEQVIDKPTRITEHSETIIDHIYANTKKHLKEICSPNVGCSDHCAICITWLKKKTKIPKPGHKEIYYRCFSKFDEDKFQIDLLNANLQYVYQIRDPDDAVNYWVKQFCQVYNKHAPLLKKRVQYKTKPPWLTKEIEKEIQYRDYLKKI